MERMPFISTKEMFKRLDSVVSYAALNDSERSRYDAELKAYRDITNQISYAEKRGREEGREEAQRRIALNMLDMKLDAETIAKASGLTHEQVMALKDGVS